MTAAGRRGSGGFAATAFGLRWRGDVPFALFDPDADARDAADIVVRRVDRLAARGDGVPINRGKVFDDGFRFDGAGVAGFDMYGGSRIDYTAGAGWTGQLPPTFYGTVAALTAAWRGAVPLHACAVEVDGHAILIAGDTGAGKSTLTAGLLAAGARLIGDDLTIVTPAPDGTLLAQPGRPMIRLDEGLAGTVAAHACAPVADDPRGKWQVAPVARAAPRPFAIAGMILLGPRAVGASPADRLAALTHQIYRPNWIAALPNHRALRRTLVGGAAGLSVARFAAIDHADDRDPAARAAAALMLARAMTGR